jgi:predicted metal-binding protein
MISCYFNRGIDTVKIIVFSNHKPGILNNYIRMQNRNYSTTIKHCIRNNRTIQNTKYTQQCNHTCLIQKIGISLEKQNRNENAIKQVNCMKTTGKLSCISYKTTRQSRTVYKPIKNIKESKISSIQSVSNKFLMGFV